MDIENWNGKYLKCFWIVQEILNIEIRWIRGVMSQLKASHMFCCIECNETIYLSIFKQLWMEFSLI